MTVLQAHALLYPREGAQAGHLDPPHQAESRAHLRRRQLQSQRVVLFQQCPPRLALRRQRLLDLTHLGQAGRQAGGLFQGSWQQEGCDERRRRAWRT